MCCIYRDIGLINKIEKIIVTGKNETDISNAIQSMVSNEKSEYDLRVLRLCDHNEYTDVSLYVGRCRVEDI